MRRSPPRRRVSVPVRRSLVRAPPAESRKLSPEDRHTTTMRFFSNNAITLDGDAPESSSRMYRSRLRQRVLGINRSVLRQTQRVLK